MTEMENAALALYVTVGVLAIYWEALSPLSIMRYLCGDFKFSCQMGYWQDILGLGFAILVLIVGYPWLVMLHMIMYKR
jgi:hypothetical protein